MPSTQKELAHYRRIAQQSLDKFQSLVISSRGVEIGTIGKDWQAFIDSDSRMLRYINNVENAGGILGFSSELVPKLSMDQLTGRVSERFAEIDLAEHVIRELDLDGGLEKLVKLNEEKSSTCDFLLKKGIPYYFEAKFTKNITKGNLEFITDKALSQIRASMNTPGQGCIWIFTYMYPDNGSIFQSEVMATKKLFSKIGFPFTLNVQTYSHGLYGDAVVA